MAAADVLAIAQGAWITLALSAAGIALGLPLGLGLALVRWARVPLLWQIVAAYVSLLRACPLITLILLLYFALPVVGLPLGPMAAGVLALTLNTSAFNCEIWRGALMELPKDQLEAAQSVGMRRGMRLRRIVLPQVFRTSLPGLVSEMSVLIKVTPVLAVVGIVDTTRAAVRIGAATYEPLPPLFVALGFYMLMIYGLVSIQRWLERRQAQREAPA